MEFKEIKENNRIQLELENETPIYRNVKGIVIAIKDNILLLVTDFGELMEIHKSDILSISQITFPKIVSESLIELKNYYTEVYHLEYQLKKLKEKEKDLKNRLFDANFLSRFNIEGAKNRLDKSIDPSLLSFYKDPLSYHISFEANPNSQIVINITVCNHIDYPNLEDVNVEKIIRVHAPNVKDLLQKVFSFTTKPVVKNRDVVHEKESFYSVRTIYEMLVDVDENNFPEVRSQIIEALEKIKC